VNERVALFTSVAQHGYITPCYSTVGLLKTQTSILLHRNLMLAHYLNGLCFSDERERYMNEASHCVVISARARMKPKR